MKALERIIVVLEHAPWRKAALRRGIELARRSGAQLFLYVFDHDPMVVAYGEDLESGIRDAAVAHFIDSRMHALAVEAAEIAGQGVRVECDVIWAPKPHQAIIAKAVLLKADLVIKSLDHLDGGRAHPSSLDWKLLRMLPADLMLVREDSPLLPRRIVAAIDVCNSAIHPQALNEAVVGGSLRLGRYAEAEVHLAHVVPYIPAGDMVDRRLKSSYEERIQSDIDAFRSFASREEIPADRLHALSGDAADSLSQFVGRVGADLLAIGSVYRSAWDRFMLGSTAEQLPAEARCDILMIKEPEFATALTRHVDLAGWQRAVA